MSCQAMSVGGRPPTRPSAFTADPLSPRSLGNRAATFPLQLLGYDVDVVNTVQFSNHTGYGHTNGHKTTPEQLEQVFSGLEVNGLGRWRRVLSGEQARNLVARSLQRLISYLQATFPEHQPSKSSLAKSSS